MAGAVYNHWKLQKICAKTALTCPMQNMQTH